MDTIRRKAEKLKKVVIGIMVLLFLGFFVFEIMIPALRGISYLKMLFS